MVVAVRARHHQWTFITALPLFEGGSGPLSGLRGGFEVVLEVDSPHLNMAGLEGEVEDSDPTSEEEGGDFAVVVTFEVATFGVVVGGDGDGSLLTLIQRITTTVQCLRTHGGSFSRRNQKLTLIRAKRKEMNAVWRKWTAKARAEEIV